jgi:hypothetical protein
MICNVVPIPFRHGIHPERKLVVLQGTEYCDDVIQVHVKLDQLVETGTPISDKTYVPLHPGQSSMSVDVVTSTSRNPEFVTDADSRTETNVKDFRHTKYYCHKCHLKNKQL